MKINRTLTSGAAFILGFSAGWLVAGQNWNIFLTSYIPSLATLVAAFYGAKYAFQFQSDKEIENRIISNVINGNSAIFTLCRMANKLSCYKKQIIDPIRDSPTRNLEMRPTQTLGSDDIRLDIQSLYFLLETEDGNLLGEIVAEEERYRGAIEAINMRSQIHIREVQPRLEVSGIKQGGNYSFAYIEEILGERLHTSITQATDQVISHVEATLASIVMISDKLTSRLKKQYPLAIIISFKIPDSL